jgi:hypothetical protein
MRADPNCERCGEFEKIEYLLCESMHYSQVIWVRLGQVIRQYLKSVSQEHIPRVEISQLNLICNVPQPSLHFIFVTNSPEICSSSSHKKSKATSSSWVRQVTSSQRLTAYLDSTMPRPHAYFQYIGLAKFAKAMLVLQMLKELNLELP